MVQERRGEKRSATQLPPECLPSAEALFFGSSREATHGVLSEKAENRNPQQRTHQHERHAADGELESMRGYVTSHSPLSCLLLACPPHLASMWLSDGSAAFDL